MMARDRVDDGGDADSFVKASTRASSSILAQGKAGENGLDDEYFWSQSQRNRQQNWRGVLWLLMINSLVLGSLALPMLAVFMWLVLGRAEAMYLGLAYTLYRRFKMPPNASQAFRAMLRRLLYSDMYFRNQEVVFSDDQARHMLSTPKSRVMLGAHPHGMLCCGSIVNLTPDPDLSRGDVQWLVSSEIFRFPIVSEVLHLAGFLPENAMLDSMCTGQNIGFLPGGREESTVYRYNSHHAFIRDHKDFVRHALEQDYDLVPAYSFGEELTFRSVQAAPRLRLEMARRRFPSVIFWSNTGFMPVRNIDVITVIGELVKLPHIPSPTRTQVDLHHRRYMNALQKLFNEHKDEFASQPSPKLLLH